MNLTQGSQAVVEQMDLNYLMKLKLEKMFLNFKNKGLAFPPAMNELFTELLQFPSVKTRLEVNDGVKIRLLGFPERKTLTIEEEIALMNLLKLDSDKIDQLKFICYPRFEIVSTGSIFTTRCYNRSPKRANYAALLSDGKFVCIEKILCIDFSQVVILFKTMGTILETKYTPEPLVGIEFHYLPGQTMKLIGLSSSKITCHARNVKSKCVISVQQ